MRAAVLHGPGDVRVEDVPDALARSVTSAPLWTPVPCRRPSSTSANVTVRGGIAPTRAYLPGLLDRVRAGRIEPSAVLTSTVKLEEIDRAYEDVDARRTVKAAVEV